MKIFGKHSIQAAANNPNRLKKIFYGDRKTYESIGINCPFRQHSETFLEVDELFLETSLEEFLFHDRILLLDGLMDPRNIGAIIRSAAAFGFFVILRRGKGCSINSTVVQCASGGVDNTKIIELCNINTNLKILKNNGFWCYGLHETGEELPKNKDCNQKTLLVIGAEEAGISQIVKNELDITYRIKTTNFSTLNASVAASVGMFVFN